jgi:hypothetical protein
VALYIATNFHIPFHAVSHKTQQDGLITYRPSGDKNRKTKGQSIISRVNFEGDKGKWKFKTALYIAIVIMK